jgi:hypothetical protein
MKNKKALSFFSLEALGLALSCILVLSIYMANKGTVSQGYSVACKAFGYVSLSGYKLRYVSSYRLNINGIGAITITGKVFQEGRYLGSLGLQTLFKYHSNEDILNVTSLKNNKQPENEVSDEVIAKIMPKVYYQPGATQLISMGKLGNGYRMDYNSYPTAYCYH